MTEPQASAHPIGLIVGDDLKLSRLTVFFRYILAWPLAIWLSIWSIAALVAVLVAWVLGTIMGRIPAGLHEFLARYVRASTHLSAYMFLVANPWPPFLGEPGSYPVDARIDPPAPQRRIVVFARAILVIPAFVITMVFRFVNMAIAFLTWFYALVTGHMHPGMRNISAWMLGYEVQTWGYYYMLTDKYPSLSGGPTA